ncbi:Tle cognate immunity protein 4 C-terminal domain-containing protein [Paraburkholderia sacchari]|uniref:T6SS immunity protein Tli4 family protein n=1 Tax=Paraburkholderia sacchari TaxID=159450 RepID=UPI0039A46DD4
MKGEWKTHAIGRHLVDVPASAKLVESWDYDNDSLELLAPCGDVQFSHLVSHREAQLRKKVQKSGRPTFVDRTPLTRNSVALVSWTLREAETSYLMDAYFRVVNNVIRYPKEHISVNEKDKIIDFLKRCSEKWQEVPAGQIPDGIGFVVGNTILADNFPNYESWRLLIKLEGKPDVTLEVSSFVGAAEEGLRQRAGGILARMLGMAAGLSQLRNHARPVGPIQADEILVAGTQNGKRGYGFKWEAPGKSYSLAEPNLNVSLEVRESAYATNRESFSSDDEALELWDTLVNSIRLRPGAV